MANRLYYGDNLAVLREHIPDASVDLVYLDPPFNSNATYNVLFRSPTGEHAKAQIEAFEDTWHWNESAERAFDDVIHGPNTNAAELLRAMRSFLGENDMMAYLAMMAVRLLELHRVLKPTGSLYLHCDPTASHYLKIIMDAVAGPEHFRNEIIWKRYGAHNDVFQGSSHFGRVHDSILFFGRSHRTIWNQLFSQLDPEYVQSTYRYVDEATGRRFRLSPLTGPGGAEKGNPVYEWNGHTRAWRIGKAKMQAMHDAGLLHYSSTGYVSKKLYLEASRGTPVQSVWSDIGSLAGSHRERLGYPTQKPLALLERIISASSNPGDIVLDPFCGCGTAIHAAQKLGRQWIGIDVTHLAIALIEKRLTDAFPGITFDVIGTPEDLESARDLARRDPYQFQWWAVSLVNAQPYGGKRKGADSGIDGLIYFRVDNKATEKAIVSVKGGGNVSVAIVRELGHVVEREKAKMGLLVMLAEPTQPMRTEAVKAGFYETWMGRFPKLQILTVAELLAGRKPELPILDPAAFRRAPREKGRQAEQGKLI
jgi:DNA modification methylase